MQDAQENNQEDNIFNQEPVYYCKGCLSLRIRGEAGVQEDNYCDICGSTDIGKATIFEWREMYKERYGHYFIK